MVKPGRRAIIIGLLILVIGGGSAAFFFSDRDGVDRAMQSLRSLGLSGVSPSAAAPKEPSFYDHHLIVGVSRGNYYDFTVLPLESVIQYPASAHNALAPAPDASQGGTAMSASLGAKKEVSVPPAPPAENGKPPIHSVQAPKAPPTIVLQVFKEKDLPENAKFVSPELFLSTAGNVLDIIQLDLPNQTISRAQWDQLRPSSDKGTIITDKKFNPICRITP